MNLFIILIFFTQYFVISGQDYDINWFIEKLQSISHFTISSKCGGGEQNLSLYADEKLWHEPYEVEITHISKTGGVSFIKDVAEIFRRNSTTRASMWKKGQILNAEKCFEGNKIDGAKTIVMLRSPAAHVFSQFNEFYNTSFGFIRRAENYPDTRDLRSDYITWLQHFSSLSDRQVGIEYDYNGYDPRNFQTRFMSCDSDDYRRPIVFPHHAHYPPPDLNRAIRNLQNADFVGVTDLYIESVCLLGMYVHGKPAQNCFCDHRNSDKFEHYDHGVDHLSLEILLKNEIDSHVRKFTTQDRVLFANALLRVLCDIRSAEEYLNGIYRAGSGLEDIKLLCPEKLSDLRQRIGYLGLFD